MTTVGQSTVGTVPVLGLLLPGAEQVFSRAVPVDYQGRGGTAGRSRRDYIGGVFECVALHDPVWITWGEVV